MKHTRFLAPACLSLVAACNRGPDDPGGLAPRRPPDNASRPPTIEAAARLLADATDAASGAPHTLPVPAPRGTVFVGFGRTGATGGALIEARRAWVGRAGAERAFALWRQEGERLDAGRAARVVMAMAYPRYVGLLGGESVPLGDGGAVRGPAPALTDHPGGGRVLTFSFLIPGGEEGAGLHVARWRWTDSDLLIEETPHPERR